MTGWLRIVCSGENQKLYNIYHVQRYQNSKVMEAFAWFNDLKVRCNHKQYIRCRLWLTYLSSEGPPLEITRLVKRPSVGRIHWVHYQSTVRNVTLVGFFIHNEIIEVDRRLVLVMKPESCRMTRWCGWQKNELLECISTGHRCTHVWVVISKVSNRSNLAAWRLGTTISWTITTVFLQNGILVNLFHHIQDV